jgi:competence protein ComGC
MRPKQTLCERQRGFAIVDLLLVIAMISVVAGFVVVSIVRGNRPPSVNTGVELVGYCKRRGTFDPAKRERA